MKVSVFVPCYIDQMEPQIGIQMIQILENLGCEVEVNNKAFCCGQPAFNAGFQAESKQVCEKFLNSFKNSEYVIIPSASCSGFLKNYAPELLKTQTNKTNKIYEFIDFITHFLTLDTSSISFPHRVAYHTSCAALREYKTTENTYKILKQIPNLELINFEYSEACCGFGGTFAEKFSSISINMAKHKLEMLQKAQIEYVVSNDSSCLFQLKSVAEKMNIPLKFLHIVEILNHINK